LTRAKFKMISLKQCFDKDDHHKTHIIYEFYTFMHILNMRKA